MTFEGRSMYLYKGHKCLLQTSDVERRSKLFFSQIAEMMAAKCYDFMYSPVESRILVADKKRVVVGEVIVGDVVFYDHLTEVNQQG